MARKMKRTSRGFVYSNFKDLNGQECSIQKSSRIAATLDDESIWFGVNNNEGRFQILPSRGHPDLSPGWQEKKLKEMFPGCDILTPDRMHLTRKMVKDLLPILQHFAETGELPER